MKISIFVILFVISCPLLGQTEIGLAPRYSINDTVDFNKLDQLTMNQLLMIEMGKCKGTKKLIYDSLLFKAAEFHALYLSQKNDCGHNEPEFPWALNKSDRINFFISRFDEVELETGAKRNTVESAEICCLFTVRNKMTYQELTNKIITIFRGSPDHWKIIIQRMGNKKFVNAASVIVQPIQNGFRIAVVILPNYYNKAYSENPKALIKTTQKIQNGAWDKFSKEDLFTSEEYNNMIIEYSKRKRLVN